MARKKGDNKWKDFETLIYNIEKSFENYPDLKVTCEKNAYLIDKLENRRQIDILIKIENINNNISNLPYLIAIECKDYRTSKVSIEKIEGYVTKYNNITQVQQVFVIGKKGFQSGSIKVANHYNIGLYEVPDIDLNKVKNWLGIDFINELHLDILMELKQIETYIIEKIGESIIMDTKYQSNKIGIIKLYYKDDDKICYLDTLNNFIQEEISIKQKEFSDIGMLHRIIRKDKEYELNNIPIDISFEGIYLALPINETIEYIQIKEVKILLSLNFSEFLRPVIKSIYYKSLNKEVRSKEAEIADFPLVKQNNVYRIIKDLDSNSYKSFLIDENNELKAVPYMSVDIEKKEFIRYDGVKVIIPDYLFQ